MALSVINSQASISPASPAARSSPPRPRSLFIAFSLQWDFQRSQTELAQPVGFSGVVSEREQRKSTQGQRTCGDSLGNRVAMVLWCGSGWFSDGRRKRVTSATEGERSSGSRMIAVICSLQESVTQCNKKCNVIIAL